MIKLFHIVMIYLSTQLGQYILTDSTKEFSNLSTNYHSLDALIEVDIDAMMETMVYKLAEVN
ncbi:hypothetical protein NWE55_14595 [Myroides albus]|uniref:hypothetical protein n=1 Tax=Myroides albus TaxID=2562892 RepID=UPI002158B549|nr:hypothetical protein [Myroides albus]UVD79343.1 hypothetical protein NWE55_14595 [Myroides albus]